MNRLKSREILECASFPALWVRGLAMRKRQRTAALQDAVASKIGSRSHGLAKGPGRRRLNLRLEARTAMSASSDRVTNAARN